MSLLLNLKLRVSKKEVLLISGNYDVDTDQIYLKQCEVCYWLSERTKDFTGRGTPLKVEAAAEV